MANPSNKINWSPEQEAYIRDNYNSMPNTQIAKALGMVLATVSNKAISMGLRRFVLKEYTSVQMNYIRQNYQTKGDTELCEYFKKEWKNNRPWNAKQIGRKRMRMGLIRTEEEIKAIYRRLKLGVPRQKTIVEDGVTKVVPLKKQVDKIKPAKAQLKAEVTAAPIKVKQRVKTKDLKPQAYSNRKMGKVSEKRFVTKPLNNDGKVLVRLDDKTQVYVNPGYNIDDLRAKYLSIKPIKDDLKFTVMNLD